MSNVQELLKSKLAAEHYEKLSALANDKLHKFVADAIELTKPASVYVCTDAKEDLSLIHISEPTRPY